MNRQALETSSKEVRDTAKYVDQNLPSDILTHRQAPLVYYFLNKFDNNSVGDFIDTWPPEEHDYHATVYEEPHIASLYADLISEYTNPRKHETIRQIQSQYRSLQTKKGGFPISDFQHSGPLWFLSLIEPHSQAVKDGVEYFLNEVLENEQYQRMEHLSLGILALSEIDYYEYESEIERMGEELIEIVKEKCDGTQFGLTYGRQMWMSLFALNRIPHNTQNDTGQIVEEIHSDQNPDGSFSRQGSLTKERSVFYASECGLGLIAAGYGPKVGKFEKKWEKKKRNQKVDRLKPEFVQTVPIDPSAEYAAEIQESSEEVIGNAKNTLRINSLYIDMLFDDIIDKVETNPELEVKILTRGRSVKGNRKRIKKDVLDDLIQVTDGNVREYHRVHSRLLISDSDQMVVSSADLTRDQLRDQFNAGIYTKDSESVSKAIDYFEKVWNKAEQVT